MGVLGPEDLKKIPIFENLDPEEVEKIIGLSERQTYKQGDFVFLQDEEARKLFVVEEGLVGIIIRLSPDYPKSVEYILNPSIQLTIVTESRFGAFGWSALLPPQRYTASAECFEPCQLLAFEGAKLRELCYREAHLGVKVMEGLARFIAMRIQRTNLQLLGAVRK